MHKPSLIFLGRPFLSVESVGFVRHSKQGFPRFMVINEGWDRATGIPVSLAFMQGLREPDQVLRLHANHAFTRTVNVGYQKEGQGHHKGQNY